MRKLEVDLTEVFDKKIPSTEVVLDKLIFEEDPEIDDGIMQRNDIYGQISRLFDTLIYYKEHYEETQEEKTELEAIQEDMEIELAEKEEELENYEMKVGELESHIEELSVDIRNKETEISDLVRERDMYADDFREAEDRLSRCERGY